MSEKKYTNISVGIREGNFCFKYGKIEDESVPFSRDEKDIGFNVKIELGIAKVFHKVLNLIKTNTDLFQKDDYELLGEMLSKILFGRVDNSKDARVLFMKMIESILEITDERSKKECRIFLEFDQKSGVAMLPWEYVLYKVRTPIESNSESNDGAERRSWYISASLKSRFHLIRRIKKNPVRDIDADRLFMIVLMNVDGNRDATPPIDSRQSEVTNVKDLFANVQKAHPNFIVEFLEATTFEDLKGKIEDVYNNWAELYGEVQAYGVHYLGHSMLDNQVGMLVMNAAEDRKASWVEDKKFASLFSDDRLNIPGPDIVCFQSCDSAKIGSFGDALRGVAYEFTQITSSVPAVVGMQNEINPPTSCAFFERFYACLLQGNDVAEAMTNGRDYLGRVFNIKAEPYSNNSFGSPVLFITTLEPIKLVRPKGAAIVKGAEDTVSEGSMANKRYTADSAKVKRIERKVFEEEENVNIGANISPHSTTPVETQGTRTTKIRE